MRPIRIIGGGIAGLSLGIALRNHGVPVTIEEAGHYPRHKVCGEFLSGAQTSTFERLGIKDLFHGAVENTRMAWFEGERRRLVRTLPEPARGLSRYRMDRRLADRFRQSGGILRTGHRHRGQPGDGDILATGCRTGRSPWIGLKIHVRDFPLAHDLEMHLGRGGYAGLSRIEDDKVNVCGLFYTDKSISGPKETILLRYLHHCGLGRLAENLAASNPDAASASAVSSLVFKHRAPEGDVLRLGDAHRPLPPFTGNGMSLALESAEHALPGLQEYCNGRREWNETVRGIQGSMRRRFRMRHAVAGCLHTLLLRERSRYLLATAVANRLLPFRLLYAILR